MLPCSAGVWAPQRPSTCAAATRCGASAAFVPRLAPAAPSGITPCGRVRAALLIALAKGRRRNSPRRGKGEPVDDTAAAAAPPPLQQSADTPAWAAATGDWGAMGGGFGADEDDDVILIASSSDDESGDERDRDALRRAVKVGARDGGQR
jgi:hypothetical protein